MLLSHERRFIFLKPFKTGGTSVEFLLSGFMGRHDVVTLPHIRDVLRFPSRNYMDVQPPAVTPSIIEGCRSTDDIAAKLQAAARPYRRYFEHMKACEVKDAVPPIIWEQYLKISMTRHPYEVVVSSAYWHPLGEAVLRGEAISLAQVHEAVDGIIDKFWTHNFPLFAIDDEVVADYVIRYDCFEQDISVLLARLGLPAGSDIPRLKSEFRQDRRSAHEILTAEQKRKIREINYREFELFGYEV